VTQSSSQPLSVGNVVTTAFQLYKNRFQPYFLLALKAYFWLLVPVYGWAKFSAISALLSRLVYGELVNQPETIEEGTRHVNTKLWQFFLAGILLGLIAVGAYIVFSIAVAIAIVAAGLVGSQLNNFTAIAIASVVAVLAFIAFLVGFFWFFIRFFVFELPLAVEDNMDSSSTISRSWELTKGFVGRILLISFVAFLITFPLLALVQFVSLILQSILASSSEQNPVLGLLFFILTLALSFSSGAIQLPFWQAIKAVVYYDLRTRKEGLGLKLRDRNI
jgi:membrane-anchored glycerophosphoryl diester phosphodiesterase (GDPDase)